MHFWRHYFTEVFLELFLGLFDKILYKSIGKSNYILNFYLLTVIILLLAYSNTIVTKSLTICTVDLPTRHQCFLSECTILFPGNSPTSTMLTLKFYHRLKREKMMAQRKLQQEIDKVFKRVNEGLSAFDYLYEKLTSSENPSQKEKLESDLKKEIKKLQRQREQIKSWLSGNDVKDKKQLLDYRKKIERQMERFKVVERDMKTKAFSKEGLNMEKKLDPKEREKLDAADFISDHIDKINQQNEALEAKIALIHSSVKKNKKMPIAKQTQITEYNDSLERNRWHLGKLEIVLRFLENGKLQPDQITDLKDAIVYYVESNQDPEFYDDDTVYDDLGLDDIEPTFGTVGEFASVDPESDSDSKSDIIDSDNGDSVMQPSEAPNGSKKDQVTDLSTSIGNLSVSGHQSSTPSKKPLSASSALSAVSSELSTGSSILSSLKPAPVPQPAEVKYSSLVQQQQHQQQVQQQQLQQQSQQQPQQVQAQPQTQTQPPVQQQPPTQQPAQKLVVTPVVSYSKLVSNLNAASHTTPTNSAATSSGALSSAAPSSANSAKQENQERPEKQELDESFIDIETISEAGDILADLPGLSDLVSSFEQNKNRVDAIYHSISTINGESESTSKYLSDSLINCPDSFDSEKPFNYFASRPHPTSIDYPIFKKNMDNSSQDQGKNQDNNFCLINHYNSKELFSKFGVETLFFIFYYGDDNGANPTYYTNFHQENPSKSQNSSTKLSDLDFNPYENGSYIQFLALKELYNRNWRFNKKLHVWLQKLTPQEAHEVNHKGDSLYKFFDWEIEWGIKLKEIELDFNNEDFEKW